MPRRYTLGIRDATKRATRERIVEVTLRLYRDIGVAAATVPVIARAADVAPATVRNHFPDPTDLAAAVADAVLVQMEMPDEHIFAGAPVGADGMNERVERLLIEMGAFFERANDWWPIREADRSGANVWAGPEARYDERFAALLRAAVAPLEDDPVVLAVVGSTMVQGYFALRSAGISAAATIEVERAVLVPWLRTRLP